MTDERLLELVERLEKVFHDGHAGFTTMNHFATEIFELTTFVKKQLGDKKIIKENDQ